MTASATTDAGDVGAEQAELLLDVLIAAVDVVDALDVVVPCACNPASTSDAEARKSVAMTCAPARFGTPREITVLPWIERFAPRRCSSSACWKRFSKMVSVMVAAPLGDRVQRTELRLHVGREPGVRRRLDVDRLRTPAAHVELDPVGAARDHAAPASASFCSTASRCSGCVCTSFTRPPVIAAATR